MSAPAQYALKEIWRYPIKSFGREQLQGATRLEAGKMLPHDRRFAIAHERSKVSAQNGHGDLKPSGWYPCANFLRGAIFPAATAVTCRYEESAGEITLEHPRFPPISANPTSQDGANAIIDWIGKLDPPLAPVAIHAAPKRGLSDTDFPSISLINLASLLALGQFTPAPISPLRWRANLMMDGAEPWQEFAWIGRELFIGEARLRVVEPIKRCKMTMCDPMSGERDLPMLELLKKATGSENFGVYCEVTRTGDIAPGSPITLH